MSLPVSPPRYGGRSLADVLPAALTALGVPGEATGPPLTPTQRVAVVLIDGLGTDALLGHPVEAAYLTTMLDDPDSALITTVFPSTTPIALTSLGTGLAPGEHGITGLFLRLETGQLVNTLALPAQADYRALQPGLTAFERAADAGVAVTRVGPAAFATGGFSGAGLRGGDYVGAESVGERISATATAVRRGERAVTYTYFGDLDATGHRSGCTSPAWRAELVHVDRYVEQLAAALPGGTTLVVTSDHGMLDVPMSNRWDVATTPALDDGVAAVSGDLRGVQVHVHDGAVDDVLSAWRETLGSAFWVVPQDEAVEAGLYGKVRDHVRKRLGDLLALAVHDHVVVDSRIMPPPILRLVGMHGGVTPGELGIPLLVRHI